MADTLSVLPTQTAQVGDLVNFIPEPKSILGSGFQALLQTGAGVAGNLLSGGIDPQYQALIQEQMRQQQQMQLVSLVSNSEKSKHETAMTPLRNIRVG